MIHLNKNNFTISLIGNPNTGKSTLFNTLTGLHQHTGNWPGKTVTSAEGKFTYNNINFNLIDLPGTYSLFPSSAEEEVSRDFIIKGNSDLILVVADGTCLERSLNLFLQIKEFKKEVILCVNMLDEMKKKSIYLDQKKLEELVKTPVVVTSAGQNYGIDTLKEILFNMVNDTISFKKLNTLDEFIKDHDLNIEKNDFYYSNINEDIKQKLTEINFNFAESIKNNSIKEPANTLKRDIKIDDILTSKRFGIPIMILLLAIIFWITIEGANYPSELLGNLFLYLKGGLIKFLNFIHLPIWLISLIIDGVYTTLTWVISVMLPPMAIFFPLFTILEDLGYLPRIAFNMDYLFKRACAHGKQCLTMCMGFGCNAAGVIGCRIIDSPRERTIAIITNSLVPCNGRFPTMIALSAILFIALGKDRISPFATPFIIILLIMLSVGITLLCSFILSKTLLKGIPSTFSLELPPYRKPKILRVLYTSLIDKTLFVLFRAIKFAAPAGVFIWILSNIYIGNLNIITYASNWLNPFAMLLGLNGVVLLAFILGLPANEIVLPIILMCYLSTGTMIEFENISSLSEILLSNDWTTLTIFNTVLFSLFHWPCSTTLLTIKKETGSRKWTFVAFILPTLVGLILCFLTTFVYKIVF